jgi:hypothetical protein
MSGLDLNGIAAARDIVSSLDEHAAKGFAEDVLLEEAKRLFSFGVQAADMVPHLNSKASQLGISFSKTELRRIIARAVAKESERYITSPTTAAYISDLAEEIRSWEEGERFSFGPRPRRRLRPPLSRRGPGPGRRSGRYEDVSSALWP